MGPAAATATAGGTGGVYSDLWGGYWEMDCDYAFTGATYYDGSTAPSSNGHGVLSCFDGCANRPGCVAFSYYGTVTGTYPVTGGGKCLYA